MAKARKRRIRKSRKSGEQRGLSLNTVSLWAFVLFSLIVLFASFISQYSGLTKLRLQQTAVIKAVAEGSAHRLAFKVAYYTQALRGIAADPQIRRLILAGDDAAKQRRAEQLKKQFPGALRLRLLRAGIFKADKSQQPHLGFACLDMQRQAEDSHHAPAVEMHVFGSSQQHIDILQPVLSPAGDKVVGHIQLALNVNLIKQWLQKDGVNSYLELTQPVAGKRGLLIGSIGDVALKNTGLTASAVVIGTRWHMQVWTPMVAPSLFNLNILLVVLVAMLLSALLIFLLRNSLSRAIQVDLENFMQMEAAFLRGIKQHDYSLKIPEFKSAAGRFDNLKQEQSLDRERDDDPDAISVSDISMHGSMDRVFMDTGVMEVQEMESDAEFKQSMSQQIQQPTRSAHPDNRSQTDSPPVPEKPGLPPASIFKAYDIRGIVGKTLTPQYTMLIGKALGSEAIGRGLGKIAFARDGRLSGPELGGALVRGLQAAGMDVLDIGMVPTPVLYYAAAELTEGTGVMLTGSHNPPDYNGIKMVLGGETLSGDTIQSLRERILREDYTRGSGEYATRVISNEYIERINSDVKLRRKLKIVIDCGNGVAGAIAPKLFNSLGCEVIELYSDVDGHFPNHHPDPSKPENLKDLIETVRAQNADLGLAFDGDGDRLGVVSSNGAIIWPDRLMMLFAADVLSRNHGAQIIYDIKCSSNLTRVIWEKGGEPLMWKTGHSLIKTKMQQTGALLAGEMSGHIFFKERWYGFDDGLYSGARLLEIIAADKRPAHEIFAALPDAVNTPELNLNMAEGEHFKFMDALLDKADFASANVTMIDGIRVDYEDGWGLVRASNTTPCLVLRFEGQNEDALKRIEDEFRAVMLAIDPSLKLPF
ncbi:Phosphoglucomutase @ Phosphomannomutase [hydrothermal vent metagenome]|uniref:Phosphoglucomutase @ Phosphomannomutase n=1 Tax=hydrothermal vent metagenome TaxID=652676 RepID=A0A3B1BU01_9ZZZZ